MTVVYSIFGAGNFFSAPQEILAGKPHIPAFCPIIGVRLLDKREVVLPNYKDRVCIYCGEKFTPTSPKQKVCCNEECFLKLRRQAEKNRYYKNKEAFDRECLICGVKFTTTKSNKKYCGSDECEKKRQYAKNSVADKKRTGLRGEYKSQYYLENREEIRRKFKIKYREVIKKGLPVKDGWDTTRLTIDKVRTIFDKEDYVLVSDEYKNNTQKLEVICPNGHNWEVSIHGFKDGDVNRCPRCYLESECRSAPQEEITKYVSDLNVGEVIKNDRTLIAPKELDIYVPDKNLAIEYCGLRWHSEVAGGKKNSYHYEKMMACYDKGVRLITIFEDEYLNKPEVVLSRIKNALGACDRVVYARKCFIREISHQQASAFLDEYHLQGKSTSSTRFGLFFGNELLQVMTFGFLSRTHTQIKGKKTAEMKRFACLPGISVVGGASKLFKHGLKYLKAAGFEYVKSYCDMRYANIIMPVYEKLGFTLQTFTKYTPHYVKGSNRYRNQGLRKTPEERLTGKTEWELRREQGYDRLFDCGHRTYIFEIK